MFSEVLFVALLVLILHWPYRLNRRWDFLDREYGQIEALAYRYTYGPNNEDLDYTLMRRLQQLILSLLHTVWAKLRGNLISRLIDLMRRWLGL